VNPAQVAVGGLLAQLELPQVDAKFPPDHHEAYWFYGHDEASHIGWYFYLLADLQDATLRHERAYLVLPDGTLLAAEGQGRRSRGRIAGADGFECECVVPFFRWQLRYRGSMQRIAASDRLQGAARGEPVDVELAIDASAATPAWNVEGDWGEPPPSLRYHQLCQIAGDLRIGSNTVALRGTAFRSHSRRLRELGGFAGHSLANALFPSGRAFGFMRFLDAGAAPARGRGFVMQDGRMVDADVVVTPMLESAQTGGEPLRIELRSEFGHAVVTGETIACAFKSYGSGGRRLGLHPSMAPGFVLGTAWATFEWDRERAGGVIERAATLAKASAFA
jgi:hypothetical protein